MPDDSGIVNKLRQNCRLPRNKRGRGHTCAIRKCLFAVDILLCIRFDTFSFLNKHFLNGLEEDHVIYGSGRRSLY